MPTASYVGFHRVVANPPFSQNYSTTGMKYKERFKVFMPEKGKKADLMFVQHMVAVLKADGKLAVIMPHGVLFRGGAEKECRKRFIEDGILDAIISLPPGLFYGTGIPACVLVLSKAGAAARDGVLIINADREYKEGKNQNSLRPEDVAKITHVYRNRLEVEKYSRVVSYKELAAEDYNLNIRRYVDNSPPPEPHDVRAHLHGGVPASEVDALAPYFRNYSGLREALFVPRANGNGKASSDGRPGDPKRLPRLLPGHRAQGSPQGAYRGGTGRPGQTCRVPQGSRRLVGDERKRHRGVAGDDERVRDAAPLSRNNCRDAYAAGHAERP